MCVCFAGSGPALVAFSLNLKLEKEWTTAQVSQRGQYMPIMSLYAGATLGILGSSLCEGRRCRQSEGGHGQGEYRYRSHWPRPYPGLPGLRNPKSPQGSS